MEITIPERNDSKRSASVDLPKSITTVYGGLTQSDFDNKYHRIHKERQSFGEKFKKRLHNVRCSSSCCLSQFKRRFPIIEVVRRYKPKDYILGDVMSGLSLAVMTVPMSLGYALLASLPPIVGLYTSFFPPLIYILFGTSRHVSMGTMAFSSLVISGAVSKGIQTMATTTGINGSVITQSDVMLQQANGTTNFDSWMNSSQQYQQDCIDQEKIAIAMSMSCLAGVILIVLSFLKLEFCAAYISDQFIAGYFTGGNLQVLTHQVRYMLGVNPQTYSGPLSYFYFLIDMLSRVPQMNIAAFVISIISCIVLFVVKKFVNEKYKQSLKVPVPIDFIVVVIATTLSYFCRFEDNFGVAIVKKIPRGLPSPTLPQPTHMANYIPESVALAINCYLMVLMMGKIFSQRHNYAIDVTQEMFATGICSFVGSFFTSMAPSISPPRSFLMESTGGRSQFAYVISAVLVLLTLFFLAPLLESLPICVLASLVLIACFPLFELYRKCVYYWKTSKYDFSIWLVSAVVTLLLGIDYGMFIGIGYSFIVTVYRTQKPYISTLTLVQDTGLIVDERKNDLQSKSSLAGTVILHFQSPLYFATLELFKEKIRQLLLQQFDRTHTYVGKQNGSMGNYSKNDQHIEMETECLDPGKDVTFDHVIPNRSEGIAFDKTEHRSPLSSIIVDASGIGFMDTPGAHCLASMYRECQDRGVTLAVAAANESVRSLLERVPLCQTLLNEATYPSIQDAILALRRTGAAGGFVSQHEM